MTNRLEEIINHLHLFRAEKKYCLSDELFTRWLIGLFWSFSILGFNFCLKQPIWDTNPGLVPLLCLLWLFATVARGEQMLNPSERSCTTSGQKNRNFQASAAGYKDFLFPARSGRAVGRTEAGFVSTFTEGVSSFA